MLELRNGATVLDFVEYNSLPVDAGDYVGYVLAEFGDEYVTWMYNREENKGAECYHGHYLGSDDVEARLDFVTRVKEFQGRYPAYVRHHHDTD